MSQWGIRHRRGGNGAPSRSHRRRTPHRAADQWLYVAAGTGVAVINGHKVVLRTGTLVLIEAGDTHQIRNTGRGLLKTVNVYVPPAYDSEGQELPPGEP